MAENKTRYVKELVFHFFATDKMEPLLFSRWQNILAGQEVFSFYRSCSARIAHVYVEYEGRIAVSCHEVIGGIYDFDEDGIIDKKRLISLDKFNSAALSGELLAFEEQDFTGKVIDAREVFLKRRRTTISWFPADQELSLIFNYLSLS